MSVSDISRVKVRRGMRRYEAIITTFIAALLAHNS